MASKKVLSVYEHGTLYMGCNGFEEPEFNALVRYNDRHKGRYCKIGYKKVTFRSFVGVIQIGKLIIEVLPKAERGQSLEDASQWRGALLTMLENAGYIRLHTASQASLDAGRHRLFDIFLYIFLQETEKLVHGGLIKRYRHTRGNGTVLKGRLLIDQQIIHNTVHKERFFTAHSVYDKDHTCNQILKAALTIIHDATFNSKLKQVAARLLLCFEGIKDWQGKETDWEKVSVDRKTQPYEYALELAKLLITGYCPDFSTGNRNVVALLFDMNQLFERYVYRMLKKAEVNFHQYSLQVIGQHTASFWAHKTIRPDIIVSFRVFVDGLRIDRKVIIDTKWKIVEEGAPSDSDLKQLYVYNRQLAADHAVLMYPSIGQLNKGPQPYKPGLRDAWSHSCEMYFGRLFVEGTQQLDKEFAQNFLAYLVLPPSAMKLS